MATRILSLIKPIFRENFTAWWKKFRARPSLPAELVSMIDHYTCTPDVKDLHDIWRWHARHNIEQLATHGLENFKQTAAKNYFTWRGSKAVNYWYEPIINDEKRMDFIVNMNQVTKKHALLTMDESIQQNIITIALYHDFIKKNGTEWFNKIEEPSFGNPAFVTIDGHRITQDLLNSLVESITVMKELPRLSSVIEIGAGGGRTAHAFLSLNHGLKYTIVDIPPALYISQQYLSSQFSGSKIIFKFRPFSNFDDIKEEFNAADIAFLTPDQMRLLPSARFDVFLAIDCLAEMKPAVVCFYFDQASRLARSIYIKSVLFRHEYPDSWKQVYERKMALPRSFFESFHEIIPR